MKSLRFKLAFAYASLVTLTLCGLLAAGRYLLGREMVQALEWHQRVEFEELQYLVTAHPPRTEQAWIERLRDDLTFDDRLFLVQLRTGGRTVFSSPGLTGRTLPSLPPPGAPRTVTVEGAGRLRMQEFALGPLRLSIASPLQAVEQTMQAYWRNSLLLLPIGFLCSFFTGYYFTHLALRPVRHIESIARRITAGNLSERIPEPRGADEVARLAGLLNGMFDRLETSFREIRRFTADASHELKTPLAILRLQTERLLASAPGEECSALLRDQLESIARLHRIIENLLTLAKADSRAIPLQVQVRPTEEFVREVAEDAQLLAEQRDLQFAVVDNTPCAACFDPVWLRQVWWNLLSNALKHSPPRGRIELRSAPAAGVWRWRLTDEGPGVPPSCLPRLGERFYRADPTDGGNAEGSGLGLAIARSIVELQGGTLHLANRSDRSGLAVEVELPLAPDPAATTAP